MKDHNIRQIVSQISKTMILLKKEIISLKKDKKYLIKRVNNLEQKLNNVKKISNKNKQINNKNKQTNNTKVSSTNNTKVSSTNNTKVSSTNDKIKIVLNSNKVNKQTLEEIIFELKKIDEDGNIFTITKLECPEDDSEADEKVDYFYNFYLGDTLINATDKLFTYEKYE